MLSLFVFYSLVHLLLYGAPQVFFFNFLTQLGWVITVVILLISSGHFPRIYVATRYWYFVYSQHFVVSFIDSCWCLFDILIHVATQLLNIIGFVRLQIIGFSLVVSTIFLQFWCGCLIHLLNNWTLMWPLFYFTTAQCIVVFWIKRCTYLLAFARWLSMRNKFYAQIYYNTNHSFRALVFESTYLLYRFKQLPSNLTFKLDWD